MPTIEEQCYCRCSSCLSGDHCGILDNDCHMPKSPNARQEDDGELWDDEMRASAGFFDASALGNPLDPEGEEDDDSGEE